MERMGDILAKSATRRAGQRVAPSKTIPTPQASTPASTPPTGQAPTSSRVQRSAPSSPLARRAAVRARPLVRPRSDASEPAQGSSTVLPSASRRAEVYPLADAQPADALPADRILELSPRRGGSPRQPSPMETAGGSSSSLARRSAGRAESAPERRVEPLVRRAGGSAPMGPVGMLPLRELAGAYLTNRPEEAKRETPPARRATGATETPGTSGTSPRRATGARAASAAGVCPLCGGIGFLRLDVPVGDPSFGHAVPCSCKERQKEEQRRSDLRRLSSLDPFIDKTFETFEPRWMAGVEEGYRVAREFAAEPQGWLVLRGGYGVGKTHLAAAIANYRLAAGSPVFFSIVPDLLDHLRGAFAPTSEVPYDTLFDRIREVELLVLDDLGAENGTAWASEKLFQLINYRYNFRMPTVITTNNRLLSHMDDRISSRLSDLSLVRNIVIEAQDYRRRQTAGARRTLRAPGSGGSTGGTGTGTGGRGGGSASSGSSSTPTRGRGYVR